MFISLALFIIIILVFSLKISKGRSYSRDVVPLFKKEQSEVGRDNNIYLFFDTETTGLPRDWNAPVSNLNNWPRLVQLAWVQYDGSGKRVANHSDIIKPQGFIIPREATKIHGISTKGALKKGVPLKDALHEFLIMVNQSNLLVAHNLDFDSTVIQSELLRERIYNDFSHIKKICTMKISPDFCRIPGPYGYKWPKLSELHYKLFNEHFYERHNALVDVEICAKCFFELKRRGVIDMAYMEGAAAIITNEREVNSSFFPRVQVKKPSVICYNCVHLRCIYKPERKVLEYYCDKDEALIEEDRTYSDVFCEEYLSDQTQHF